MSQKQKEITRLKLNATSDLVASIINSEKLDLRVFLHTDNYTGPIKRGVRFYLWDGIWNEFLELIKKVNKEVKELG